jgi:hypothetical protein
MGHALHNRMPRLVVGLTAAAAALVLSGCISADGDAKAIGTVNVENLCADNKLARLDPINLGRAFRGDLGAQEQAKQTYHDMQEAICMQAGKLAASVVANAQVLPDDRPDIELHMSLQRGDNDPGVIVITEHHETSDRQNTVTFGANQDGTADLDDLQEVRAYTHDTNANGDQVVVVVEATHSEDGHWTIKQSGGEAGTASYPPEHFNTPTAIQSAWQGASAAAARLDPAHF